MKGVKEGLGDCNGNVGEGWGFFGKKSGLEMLSIDVKAKALAAVAATSACISGSEFVQPGIIVS